MFADNGYMVNQRRRFHEMNHPHPIRNLRTLAVPWGSKRLDNWVFRQTPSRLAGASRHGRSGVWRRADVLLTRRHKGVAGGSVRVGVPLGCSMLWTWGAVGLGAFRR